MSTMRTISETNPNRMPYEESYALVIGFPTASSVLQAGQMVKLGSDGQVAAIAASTDKPLGVVASTYKKTDDAVRVYTPFVAVITTAIGSGITATAGEAAAVAPDSTTGNPKFKAAASADWVCGIVLKGGADGATIVVGILRTPYLKA